MNITCNIIKDLLPLYAEDMVSEDSKVLVDNHLCTCDSCTRELAELKKTPKIPMEVEATSLKRVGEMIRKRKILTAVTAMLTLVAALVTGTVFLMTPVYLTAKQAIEGVELRDDGSLAIDYSRGINGWGSSFGISEDDELIWCHTTRYDWFRSKLSDPKLSEMTQEEQEQYVQSNVREGESFQEAWDRIQNIHVDKGTWRTPGGSNFPNELSNQAGWELVSRTADKNVWYVNPRNPERNTLIWNGSQMDTQGMPYGISCTYLVLFGGCALLAVLLFLVARNRKGNAWELLRYFAILAVSVAVSVLLVTSGNLIVTEYMAYYKWPGMLACESVVLALTVLMWRKLHLVNRQEIIESK